MKKTFFTVAVAIVCAVAAQAQVFYKVSGNGLQKPSYIFGTHHLAPLSMLDSIPSAKAALDETERAVGEVDMTGGQMQLAAYKECKSEEYDFVATLDLKTSKI